MRSFQDMNKIMPPGGAGGMGSGLFANMLASKSSQSQPIDDTQGQQFTFDKSKNLSKSSHNFVIFGVSFNKYYPNLVIVAGLYNLIVLNLDQNSGKLLNTTNIEVILESDFIIKAGWVPGKKNILWVATLKGVRVFDFALDPTSPLLFFSTLDAYIRDVEVIEKEQNKGK